MNHTIHINAEEAYKISERTRITFSFSKTMFFISTNYHKKAAHKNIQLTIVFNIRQRKTIRLPLSNRNLITKLYRYTLNKAKSTR